MRIIEGKDDIEFNSCALKSDDDEDEVNEKVIFFLNLKK